MQNTGRKTAEKSFIVEALIISLSNFVVKIIGVLFKIPMTYILGVNMGIFNAAYSIYAMLFMLSTAGLPVAISRLVASANERGRPREIRRVYRLSVAMFGLIGLFCTLLLFFGAEAISNFSEHRDAALAMRVISPTLFLICISAAIRGYFQGLKNMYPTAISQFIEAFFKLAVGLGAVAVSKNLGASPAVQAAFGVSGLTVGVFLGTVFMVAYKHIYDRRNRPKRPSRESEAWRVLAKRIALIASREDLYDVQDELIDRYGEIPPETKNLLDIALIKAEASRAHIAQLSVRDGEVRFTFDKDAPMNGQKLLKAIGEIPGAQFLNGEVPALSVRMPRADAEKLCGMLPQFVYTLADCIEAN